MTSRFIIEHASRGVFIEFHHSRTAGDWRPCFSWSCLRTDPKVKWWYHREQAERMLAQILPIVKGAYILELDHKLWKGNKG